MRWVGWHSQLMNSLPGSNADIGRIEVGTLLRELLASLFRALIFFASNALGGIYQVAATRGRHVSAAEASVAPRTAPGTSAGSIAILRLIDLQGTTFEILAVQRLHCAGCIRI